MGFAIAYTVDNYRTPTDDAGALHPPVSLILGENLSPSRCVADTQIRHAVRFIAVQVHILASICSATRLKWPIKANYSRRTLIRRTISIDELAKPVTMPSYIHDHPTGMEYEVQIAVRIIIVEKRL